MPDSDRKSPRYTRQGVIEEPLAQRLRRRLGHLERERDNRESLWREIAEQFAPRTGNWNNVDPTSRGEKKGQKIINNTPLLAARTLAAGMMAGLTSPARPWFRLTTPDPGLAEYAPVKEWLAIVEQRLRTAFAKSNVYRVLPSMYRELGCFGTSAAAMYEDDQDLFRLQPWEVGSYWLAQNSSLRVDTGYRRLKMTVRQMVQEFGYEQCSQRVQNMFNNQQWEQWIDVYQAVEPNDERLAHVAGPRGMEIRSVYWELNGDKDSLLGRRGFKESPLLAPRWSTEGEQTYGDSPAMDALGDAKGLQFEERRKAQSLDKLVDPPMTAPTSLRNDRVSLLPGDVTYVDTQQGQGGYKPVYEIRPDIQWQAASIVEIQDRINSAFYADLFLMLTMSDRREITAREVEERHEEKLLQLGPVLERLNDELLDPLIDRAFAIMVRRSEPIWRGLIEGEPIIPPPPEELAGVDLKIEYISILAQAQKMAGLAANDRLMLFVGNLAAASANPAVWDKVDMDQAIDEYADMLGTAPTIIVPDDEVAQMRQDRAQQQQAAQMAQMAPAARDISGAVKDLGQTTMGGSEDTALARIVGAAANSGAPA